MPRNTNAYNNIKKTTDHMINMIDYVRKVISVSADMNAKQSSDYTLQFIVDVVEEMNQRPFKCVCRSSKFTPCRRWGAPLFCKSHATEKQRKRNGCLRCPLTGKHANKVNIYNEQLDDIQIQRMRNFGLNVIDNNVNNNNNIVLDSKSKTYSEITYDDYSIYHLRLQQYLIMIL